MTKPQSNSRYIINTHELNRSAGNSKQYELIVDPVNDFTNGAVEINSPDQVKISFLLESVIDGILLTGTAVAIAAGECSRCLEAVRVEVSGELTDLYAYSDKDIQTDEADEVRILEGDLLDLEPAVRDALVLAMPLRPLCNDNCLGLCGQCGIRMDDQPDHAHEAVDPRWARLTELKKEN